MLTNESNRNMITQQVRAWDVLNNDILDLLSSTPREHFAPEKFKNSANADTTIDLGHGQVMLAPKEVGKMLQALDILPTETVLEIGTGSGYLTALLAKQANFVHSVDILADMTAMAKANLASLKLDNISLKTGNAAQGWAESAPYDVIVISGALQKLPSALQKELNVGGRIFAFVGNAPKIEAVLLTKVSEKEWQQESLYETSLPSLLEVEEKETFNF